MNKRARQYIGILCAVAIYYIIHEGAHLVYALAAGIFKQINFLGFGIQIDIFAERADEMQLGLFCLAGPLATLAAACLLVLLINRIGSVTSKGFKACMYYTTIALLVIDPLYLSVLCGFFGGGDMNGIALLVPETAARIIFGILFLVNAAVFAKFVLPGYRKAFQPQQESQKSIDNGLAGDVY